jgi:Arc/MetJ-type ribon-helix-helix transcriptional regulator
MVAMVTDNGRDLRAKFPESEKITINLGYIDLGHVDLLVEEGFYSNRTDFIRTAIRNQLSRHEDVLKKTVSRRNLDIGLRHYSKADLEEAVRRGERLDIVVLGLASIADDVTPDLARRAIASLQVLGALRASPSIKAVLDERRL